jgi:hypothetical protein
MRGGDDPSLPPAPMPATLATASSFRQTNENFKVVIRVRPPLEREVGGKHYRHSVAVDAANATCTLSENLEAWRGGGGTVDSEGVVFNTHQHTFDHVYDQDASQKEVYERSAKDAVLSTLRGYNAAILAYGQTGTGKTYTMEGDPLARRRAAAAAARADGDEKARRSAPLAPAAGGPSSSVGQEDATGSERGIIPRAIEDIFQYIADDTSPKSKYLVRASYVQIYNEVISDLLKPDRVNLQIREDKKRGVYVEGLSEWVVRTPDEIYGLMDRGAAQRATGSTRMNELSSRSHAVFIVIVENARMEEDESARGGAEPSETRQSFRVGKLNLVDLAGSERVRLTGATGVRLEESKKINQSLSALGNVIKALTETKGTRSHVPYRDSKLTRVLEDSLGGNCKTTMMAMISPALEAFAESLSTVKFANRAKHIKNTARVNEDLDQKSLLRKYERELRRLRQELDERTKNLVDKRALLQLDEQRRKAEADKMRAITELERRSRDFLKEKKEKTELEERINAMQSQMLGNGVLFAEGAGAATDNKTRVNQRAYDLKLKKEHEKIRDEYESKIRELEADRQEAEEGRAQVGRYKAVLLKQRDIMIALTARLNERDETIIRMQEELKAYDGEYRRVEDALDAKTAELIALRRAAMRHSAESPGARDDELVAALGGWAGEKENAKTNGRLTFDGRSDETKTPVYRPERRFGATEVRDDDDGGALASELESARGELRAKSAELERLRAEISVASAQSRAARGASPPASPARASLDEASVAASAEKVAAQYREFRREMATRLEEKNGRVHFLEDENARLRRALEKDGGQIANGHGDGDGNGAASFESRDAKTAALAEKVDGFARERAALKTILENKIQSLVSGVNRSVEALGAESDQKAPRLRREVRALERLVAATVQAMDH